MQGKITIMREGYPLDFVVGTTDGIAVRGDCIGTRGDTGRPIIRLCLLLLLPVAMFKPRLAATLDARDRESDEASSVRRGESGGWR